MGQTNQAIHRAAQEKLGIGSRAVNLRRAKAQALVGMPDDISLLVVAQRAGVPIHKWIKDADVLAQVATFDEKLAAKEGAAAPAVAQVAKTRAKKAAPRNVSITIGTEKYGEVPALKGSHATEAKAMAERVYPLLYLFENSLRDLIELVLKSKYGDDWWTTAVPSKVREAADELKDQEQKDTYHGKRGRRDIDYLLLTQLWKIVNHKWKDFEPLFPPGKHWVQSVIENDMNVSRRPIAHMNPIEDEDIKNVESTFRKWVRNLQAVVDKLPQAS